jgi:hypothetical protein
MPITSNTGNQNMTRHQEFLTDDFLLYASECKRMAAFAHSPDSNVTTMTVAFPTWADLVARFATRYGQPLESDAGLGNQPAYS